MNNIGNIAYQDQRDPIFSSGGYDLDTARVPYQGAASLKSAFTAGLTSFSTLPGFPKMYLMRWPDDEDAHFPTVTLEYQGCKSGSAPPVKGEDGLSLQSLSVSVESLTIIPATTYEVTVQMDIEYYAQQTNYTWFSLVTPAVTPLYNAARRVLDLNTTVFSRKYRITTVDPADAALATVGPLTSVDTATYTQLQNALTQGHKLQEYKIVDLVPSALWQCSSTVNYQFTVT